MVIAEGATTGTLTVPTADDNLDEPDGSITVKITTGAGYTVGTLSTALVTVSDNDVAPSLDDPVARISAAAPTTITEGAAATFTVALDRAAPAGGLTLSVAVTESGSYIAGSAPRTVTIPIAVGATTGTLTVLTEDDNLDEPDGSITVRITTGVGYTVGTPSTAMVTVSDNDVLVDEDGDGLIEIRTLADLNNIRYNLGGTSAVSTLVPDDPGSTVGCPTLTSPIWVHNTTNEVLTSAPSAQDTASYTRRDTCYGYELVRSLDFNDANNDGNADDAYDTDLDTTNGNWTPIGDFGIGNQFTGTFDGNGNTISNMSVAITGTSPPAGLFVAIYEDGVIRDVGLVGVSVRGGADSDYAGGLAGENEGTISGSYVTGSVSGETFGLATGGLAGTNIRGTISDSYFIGSVTGRGDVGGLVGVNFDAISNSYATGSVNSDRNAGGLVGSNSSGGTISDSYATGSVTGSGDLGGLVGSNSGTIFDSYSIGPVNGSGNLGGLVGYNDESFGRVENSYWNIETSGQLASAGGAGRTTLQLVTPTTASVGSIYELWTARSTVLPGEPLWDFGDNRQYPGLRLPLSTDDCTVGATTALCTHRPAFPDGLTASIVAGSLSITEGAAATFTVTLDRAAPADGLTISVEVTESGSYITGAVPTTVAIAGGATTGTLTVSTDDDEMDERSGTITVRITTGAGYAVATLSTATVTVNDNETPAASISAGPSSITEGTAATFRVTLGSAAPADGLTISVEVTQSGSYIDGPAPVTVFIASGATTEMLTVVTEDDSLDESDGSITVRITTGAGYTVADAPDNAATTTVLDNETPVASISAGPSPITEGTAATFTVAIDLAAPAGGLIIDVDVTQSGSYIDGLAPTGVFIDAGATTGTLTVPTEDDSLDEPDGSITAELSAFPDYTVADAPDNAAAVTVLDNDDQVARISADPTTITEGEVATFTVALDLVAPAGGLTISVDVIESGSYIDGLAPATVVIAEGATTGMLTVSTEDDNLDESDGSITAELNAGAGYTVGTPSTALVTVSDNDVIVDEDGDGLIEIHTLTDLNNIRYNLGGTSAVSTLVPDDPGSTVGCPTLTSPIWVHNTTNEVLTSAPSAQDTASYTRRDTCYGYELVRSLDFNDANNDGTHDDAYDTDLDTTNGNWTPIGSSDNQFNGTFEGNGNTISNMSVDVTNASAGLFGVIYVDAVIRYVGLVGVSVRANRTAGGTVYVGGLVGASAVGTIIGSYVTGSVSGDRAGGLVGQNNSGTIHSSYVTGSVTGEVAGGLVGWNNGGTIRDSYATGSVIGDNVVGGLVGFYPNGAISNSYAIGPVNGSGTLGGLIGSVLTSAVRSLVSSYWNTDTSGQLASAGGIGQNTLQLVTPTAATGSIYELWTAESTVLPGELLWDFGDDRQYPGLRLPLSTDDCTVSATTALCTHRPAPIPPRVAEFVETALTVVEGNTVAVDVKLSYPSTEPVTVAVTSLGASHIATNSAVTIPAGATTGTVLLATFGNRNNTVDNEVQVSLAMSEVVGSGLGYVIGVNSRATITVLANRPPVISSRSFSVGENTTAVGTVVATDREDAITDYTITGVDEASFAISTTGALTFNTAPDFENPQGGSANNSNTYELVVMVSSGIGIHERAASQAITVTVTDLVDEDGDGLIEIRTLTELNNIRFNLGGTARATTSTDAGSTTGCPGSRCSGYELVRSLDFNDANNDGNDDDAYDTDLDTTNGNWTPLGDFGNDEFSGTFDGNGNTISNMSVAVTSAFAGLFEIINRDAVIRYVGLVGVSVRGTNTSGTTVYLAGLVGQNNNGTIIGSYVTGSVRAGAGTVNVGGLVGNNAGTIRGSYFTGSVSGQGDAGGLVGNNSSTIRDSYATGSVSGATPGGLAGFNFTGSIRDSYAIVSVIGTDPFRDNAGGLVGSEFNGSVRDSYWNTETSGQLSSAGGVGQTTRQLVTQTAATGSIYESWLAGSAVLPGEPLWDFGENRQYPGLRLPLSTADCTVNEARPLCPHRPEFPDDQTASIATGILSITEGAAAPFTVTLSNAAPAGGLTINVEVTESGSYITGAVPTTVFIAGGATTGMLTVLTDDDRVDESTGIITAAITIGTGYIVDISDRAMIIVNDNDTPVANIAAGPSPIIEGTTAVFTVTLDLAAPAGGLTIKVDVTESGSYIDGSAPMTVVIASGARTGMLTVRTEDDNRDEPTGIITAVINMDPGYIVGIQNTARVTVNDNDDPVANIAAGSSPIAEGAIATFRVTLSSGVPAGGLMINVEVTESGNYIAGSAPMTVVIAGGATTGTLTVRTDDDNRDELTGIITAELNLGTGYTVGSSDRAMVTVLDNDTPIASIAAGSSPITEGTVAIFTVALDLATPAGGLTVSVEVTESASYIAGSAPLTVFIAAGATTGTLAVRTEDDSRDEPSGIITAALATGAGYTVGTLSSAMVTVNDDDVLLASIVAGISPITEGEVATFRVTLDLAAPAGGLTINVGVTESGRYIASSAPMTVAIAGGSTTGTLTVLIDEENRDEPAGIITAALTMGTGYTVGSPDRAMVIVAANFAVIPLSIGVTNGGALVVDGSTVTVSVGTTLRLTVVGTGRDVAGTTAMLSRVASQLPDLMADSATASSLTRLFVWTPSVSDRGTHRIEFAATLGSESTSISIDVRVILLPPPPEIDAVVHQASDGLFVAVHRRGPGGLQIRWVHNDAAAGAPPILGYRVYWYKVSDGHESAQISDLIPPAADGTVQRHTVGSLDAVEYVVTVVAVNSDGQSAFPRLVPGAPQVTEVCPTCLPYDRTKTGERVFFNSPLPGADRAVTNLRAVSNEAGEIFVSWDRPPVFDRDSNIDFGRYEVNWGIGADFRRFAVLLCTGDTAVDACPNTYTIRGLQQGQLYNVQVNSLLGLEGAGGETLTEFENFVDDVFVLVGVGVTADAGVVEGEAATFRVTLGGALGVPVTVDWAASGSAINAGPEPSGSVTIDAGKLSAAISVLAPDDSVDEDDQTLTVTISEPAGGLANGAKITTTSATVTVTDNDTLLASITAADPTTITEGTAATFTVTLDQVAPAGGLTVSVDVTGSGSYISGSAPATVVIASGATTGTLTVPTDDDNLDEPNGGVTAAIETGTGYTVGVLSTAMVTVLDNDDPAVSIAAGSLTITEGATAIFRVTLSSAAPAGGLTISVNVTDSGSYILGLAPAPVIAAGATAVTLFVPTIDDLTEEPSGTITAELNAGAGYTVGTPSTAMITVTDDDTPVVSITAGPSPITEGTAATFTVTLDRVAPVGGLTISVDVTESGSYIAGSAPMTVDIAVGVTTGTLTVSTEDDRLDETDGAITAELNAGAGYTVGTPSTAMVTVLDNDDPVVSISANRLPIIEGVPATFRVTLGSAAAAGGLTISVGVTQSGSYIDGSAPTEVFITAGATTGTLIVSTDDDEMGERSGTITVRITKGAGYTVGTLSTAMVTVLDNDTPIARITAADPTTITEGAATTFTVNLDQVAPAGGLTISVGVTQSGSYIAGSTPTEVFITAGVTTGTLTVMTEDDAADEADGSITAVINAGAATLWAPRTPPWSP